MQKRSTAPKKIVSKQNGKPLTSSSGTVSKKSSNKTKSEGSNILPRDLFSYWVDFLETKTIRRLRLVCRHYRRLIDDDTFWAGKALAYYGISYTLFERMGKDIPHAFHRYFAFRNAETPVQWKLIGTYASKEQILRMVERNPRSLKSAIYGICLTNRGKEFTEEELPLNDISYWEPALDGYVAGNNLESVGQLLQQPIDFSPALTPLFTALKADPQILALLLPYYLNLHLVIPNKLHELYTLALFEEKFNHCNVIVPCFILSNTEGLIFELGHIQLKDFKESHFSYLCGKCSNKRDYFNFLKVLIKFDCRETRWLDHLFDNLSNKDQEPETFIKLAFTEDQPNYFKFILRRQLVTLSEIHVERFSWKYQPQTMMFLARNRHPAIPKLLLDAAVMMEIDVVQSFMVPYFLAADKKLIDKAKLKRFVVKHPRSKAYLGAYI
jgi:hypothetical protein